jgi:hypothetical protein
LGAPEELSVSIGTQEAEEIVEEPMAQDVLGSAVAQGNLAINADIENVPYANVEIAKPGYKDQVHADLCGLPEAVATPLDM